MDSKVGHFDKNDVNLIGAEKSDGADSSLIEAREGNDGKTLNEATIQEINARSKSSSEDVNATSSPIVEQKLTFVNEEDLKRFLETFLDELPPSTIMQDEPPRGSARLEGLQAASDQTTENSLNVTSDVSMTNRNSEAVSHEDSTSGIYIHESNINNGSDIHKIVYHQEECNFFSSQIPSVNISSNSEENVLISEASYQPVVQNEDQSRPPTSSEGYEQVVYNISDASASNFTMPRIDKVQSCLSTDPEASMWIVNSNDNETAENINNNIDSQYQENSQATTSDYQSPGNLDEIPDTQQMQKFITADNLVVYGYKDPNGEFHFFCPALNERESHNEKERKRRSRVSDACSALRTMIPGINDKTDKATVFEQAARYLKFLREKFGTQFDQTYCEKYFKERI